MADLDVVVGNTEDRICDLRQRGLEALSMTVRADADLEAAIGREAGVALLVAGHEGDAP